MVTAGPPHGGWAAGPAEFLANRYIVTPVYPRPGVVLFGEVRVWLAAVPDGLDAGTAWTPCNWWADGRAGAIVTGLGLIPGEYMIFVRFSSPNGERPVLRAGRVTIPDDGVT